MGGVAVRLTKRIVDQAQAGPKPSFVWDSELRGFGLRIEPTGTKSFMLRYRTRDAGPSGPKRFFTIGRFGPLTVDQAREQAKAVLGAVSLGQDPAADLTRDRAEQTFGSVAELFLAEHVRLKRKAGTHADYESLLRLYALPTLGKRKLTDVTRGDLSRLHASLNDRPYRANRLLAVIGSLYSFAEKRDLVPEHYNPARRIEKFREDQRERYLSRDELERLGAALQLGETQGLPWQLDPKKPASKHLPKAENRITILSQPVAAAIRLLMFTGARLREILELRWEYVDLERGLLLLPDSKTGRKTIVLNSTARAILAGLPQQGPFVVSGKSLDQPRADLNKPWEAVRMHAGLSGVRLHDLRHTFASIGAGASLGLPIVGKLLGHNHPQTTARYAHLDADPLRQAAELIGGKLAEAIGGAHREGRAPAME
ncbi:tyrosine-type recombinase/integrase [Lichenihabitans sp. Uapishka_5]|uniref:tyrosine-type recombinase/integrase n=1 Tax=Lichenihabitans sp. Uapishka_5 TaxID=3037302 RepID=UPI0029E826EC|nr:tyrosine-type recombinase/integrase [Lichenihabitans sp. Uapishka_5]